MPTTSAIFKVLSVGLGITVQDKGRTGWRRFGVPCSSAMDDHAADWANRLLENPLGSPMLELLWQGAKLTLLKDVWIAVTGAQADTKLPMWRAVQVHSGDTISFSRVRSGMWIYVAVEGGIEAPRIFGSASIYARGKLGAPLAVDSVVQHASRSSFHLAAGVAGRVVAWDERRNYDSPPPLRVWPGPQWSLFSDVERQKFFTENWVVTSQSDRVGYRLAGTQIKWNGAQIISEPVRPGSIQVPEGGQPIITMRDGPTVGGYPKLGMIDSADISWLAQCRPGQKVRFSLVNEARPEQQQM